MVRSQSKQNFGKHLTQSDVCDWCAAACCIEARSVVLEGARASVSRKGTDRAAARLRFSCGTLSCAGDCHLPARGSWRRSCQDLVSACLQGATDMVCMSCLWSAWCPQPEKQVTDTQQATQSSLILMRGVSGSAFGMPSRCSGGKCGCSVMCTGALRRCWRTVRQMRS